MKRGGLVAFLVLAFAGSPLRADLIQGCDTGFQATTSIEVGFTLDPATFRTYGGGFTCGPSRIEAIEANGANAATAVAAADVGASAGVGINVVDEADFVTVEARSFVEYEFILEKVDPFAGNVATVPFQGEILTLHSNLFGETPFTVQYQQRRGFVEFYEEFNGTRSGPKNEVGTRFFDASLVPGAITPFSGDVDIVAGRLSSIRLGVLVRLRGQVTQDFEGSIGKLFGSFSLAISGGIVDLPEGYALNYLSATVPEVGTYPGFDAPLSLIPLPASYLFFASAFAIVAGVRRSANLRSAG